VLFRSRNLNIAGFKAEAIIADPIQDNFLHDPMGALCRESFDPLFNLLQGKIDINTLTSTVNENTKTLFREQYPLAYGKWIILNLCNILNFDAIFTVTSPEITPKLLSKMDTLDNEVELMVPAPRITKNIDFSYGRYMRSFSTVEMLGHIKKTGKYLGIKTRFEDASNTATGFSNHRTFLPFDPVKPALKNNPILIYVDDNAQSASLVADKKRFWQPDIVIEMKDPETDSLPDSSSHKMLKPILGTILIPLPNSARKPADNIGQDISVLNVGYEASKLRYIINKLI
jgi:hypothetical protein